MSLPAEPGAFSATKPLNQVHRIRPGMSHAEVRAILGDELVIGYRRAAEDGSTVEPIAIPQPYRQEEFVKNGHPHQILYYITYIVKADGLIAEDELMPFIFKDGILVGKGSDELDLLRRR